MTATPSPRHVSASVGRQRVLFTLAVMGFVLYPLLLLGSFVLVFEWAMIDVMGSREYPQETEAVVTSVAASEGWGDYEPCSLDFSFTTEVGEFTGYATKGSEALCKYEVGEEIAITYDPVSPDMWSNFDPRLFANHGGLIVIMTLLFTHLVLAGGIWARWTWARNRLRPI